MPLSTIQKGAVGQFAFLATALVTGKGQVEVYTPAIDNEGRDAEVRRHLRRAPAIGIQIKVAFRIATFGPRRTRHLEMRFTVLKSRVQNDPRLWYFFAAYDAKELRLHDPAFLIRSDTFHTMARRETRNGRITYSFIPSVEPNAHDRWAPFRVSPNDLGKRLLEIIDDTQLRSEARSEPLPADAVIVSRIGRQNRSRPSLRVA